MFFHSTLLTIMTQLFRFEKKHRLSEQFILQAILHIMHTETVRPVHISFYKDLVELFHSYESPPICFEPFFVTDEGQAKKSQAFEYKVI